jgi:hypothetical protein
MSALSILAESLNSLGKNKVRSALSMLGIVIGIASVIAMVAVGAGAQRRVEAEIQSMGDDWVMVAYWGVQRSGARRQTTLPPNQTRDDAEAMRRELPAVRAATPVNRVSMQAISAFGNYQTWVMGVYPSFFDIRRWKSYSGELFDEEHMLMRSKVCCLGATAARELFGGMNPVGQTIRVNRVAFEVIGVLAPKGVSSEGRDNDDVILFPFTTFQRMVAGTERSGTILAAAVPGVPLEVAKEQIRALLPRAGRLPHHRPDRHGPGQCRGHPHVQSAAHADRLDLAAGRRRRNHEHHAGLGDRAHARDRPAHGGRCHALARAGAVPVRGRAAVRRRRLDRLRGRLGRGRGRFLALGVGYGDLVLDGGRGDRVRQRGGAVLRVLPGVARQPARSDRGAALRVRAGRGNKRLNG